MKPSPVGAATSSPATSAIHPMPSPTRSPVKMFGSDAGSTTVRKRSRRRAPRLRPARTRYVSTSRAPAIAFSTMGKNAARKMMYSFCVSPIPNHRMLSGIQASGGIGRMNSSSGSTEARKPADHPMARPSGMPRIAPTPTATSTRRRLSAIWVISTPRAMSSWAAEDTAVGGGSMTSSWGLMRTPSVLTSSHTTRNSVSSQRCTSRLATRRHAGGGGGMSVAARAAESSATRAAADRSRDVPLAFSSTRLTSPLGAAAWRAPASRPVRPPHERPGLLQLARLGEWRRTPEEIGRVRFVRQVADAAPVLRQERRPLGRIPAELLERRFHVRGPPHVLPVGDGHLALCRARLVRPLADAAFLLRPHAVGVVERIVDGRLRPEEVGVRHPLDEGLVHSRVRRQRKQLVHGLLGVGLAPQDGLDEGVGEGLHHVRGVLLDLPPSVVVAAVEVIGVQRLQPSAGLEHLDRVGGVRLPDRGHVDPLRHGGQLAGRQAAQREVLILLEAEVLGGRDEAEVVRGTCGGPDHGRTLENLLILEVGETLERRVVRYQRLVGNARRVRGERPRRYVVGEQREDAERSRVGDLDAPWDEGLVGEAGGHERLPFHLEAALLKQLLVHEDGPQQLLTRPHHDEAGVEGPPALALEPLLGLRGDLLVG